MTSPVPASPVLQQRRRVRVALATLRRVRSQQERFATEYGQAITAQQRFAAAANALRAAAADGTHQPDPVEVARRLDRITEAMTSALAELHQAQQDQADKTIRADQRRIERNERRRGCDGRSQTHRSHPEPDGPAGPAAGSAA